jgi:flagella basal body P-ring formation protein FlgA
MNIVTRLILSLLLGLFLSLSGLIAFSPAHAEAPGLDALVRAEIAKRFPGARIELTSPLQWTQVADSPGKAAPQGEIISVSLGDETVRGEAPFSVESRDEGGLRISWGRVNYNAMVPARVATTRIMPGEAIQATQFIDQEVDVAHGMNHDIRGLIVSPSLELSRLETRQTVLEGQPLLSSEIKRMPDVRRGDPVRIELVSGSLTLTTLGTASEPGYLDQQVHVMSQKTKRELIGTLLPDNIIEVRL